MRCPIDDEALQRNLDGVVAATFLLAADDERRVSWPATIGC